MTKTSKLLDFNDPAPVVTYQKKLPSHFLIICDHAHNHVPTKLEQLGLNSQELERHIAYDLHIAAFSRQLANLLACPLIMAGYSRLVVETNRPPNDPTAMRAIADTSIIPRNITIPTKEKLQRINEIFLPYHQTISNTIKQHQDPIIISMHSFTPQLLKYPDRPSRIWEIGLLSTVDRRLTDPFLKWIKHQQPNIIVGDNLPYSGNDPYFYSINHHALRQKIPHITFEIRQDILPLSQYGNHVLNTIHQGILHATQKLRTSILTLGHST